MYKIVYQDCTAVFSKYHKLLLRFPTESEADEYIAEYNINYKSNTCQVISKPVERERLDSEYITINHFIFYSSPQTKNTLLKFYN